MHPKTLPAVTAVLVVALLVETVFLVRANVVRNRRNETAPTLSMQDLGNGVDGVRVQVKIRKMVGNNEFTDSLYYTPDEWANLSDEDVKQDVKNRINNWTKMVNTASGSDAVPVIDSKTTP